eukprot:GEMP01077778.1.p1 GENE.GEMP01077778.1~~GEMP01077778.1.p1  ORF type:complete len:122 (+),score=18.23 GEMP01077778.1:139-504(+)
MSPLRKLLIPAVAVCVYEWLHATMQKRGRGAKCVLRFAREAGVFEEAKLQRLTDMVTEFCDMQAESWSTSSVSSSASEYSSSTDYGIPIIELPCRLDAVCSTTRRGELRSVPRAAFIVPRK